MSRVRTRRGERGPRRRSFAVGPKEYETMTDRQIGIAECKTIDVNLPVDERVIAEVRQYNQRYGNASWADVVLEWNSRCKDPEFQGKTYRYAYTDIPLIQDALERLVKSGRLKKIEVSGSQPGYVVDEEHALNMSTEKLKQIAQKELADSGFFSRCACHGRRECSECLGMTDENPLGLPN